MKKAYFLLEVGCKVDIFKGIFQITYYYSIFYQFTIL